MQVAAIAIGIAALCRGETAIGVIGITLLILRRSQRTCGECAARYGAIGTGRGQSILLIVAEVLDIGARLQRRAHAADVAHGVVAWLRLVEQRAIAAAGVPILKYIYYCLLEVGEIFSIAKPKRDDPRNKYQEASLKALLYIINMLIVIRTPPITKQFPAGNPCR